MIEQWFLDLDGVRSGPYQTPEVMSLIAEGEVLPHHRIATGLRDQNWETILDWRLNQAKKNHNKKPASAPVTASVPVTAAPTTAEPKPEISSVEVPVQSPAPSQTSLPQKTPAPQKVASPPPSAQPPSSVQPPATARAKPEATEPKPISDSEKTGSFAVESLKLEKTGTFEIKKPTPPTAPPFSPPPAPSALSSAPVEPGEKRDAMSEMFDMLQNTKQKREAKQNQTASGSISVEKDQGITNAVKSSNIGKTVAIGIGITLVGFALGQIFQQTTPPPAVAPETTVAKIKPAAKVPSPTPPARPVTQVVDRSTDKMTIRGVVDKRPVPTPFPRATPRPQVQNHMISTNATPASPQTEKELEELRSLKKELQELKALKNNDSEAGNPDPNMENEGIDGREMNAPGYPNPNANPNANPNGNPNANPNSNTVPSEYPPNR